jgi:acyl-CoA reductase-like NAD-dependent aldehyde dehydrogenase
VFAEYDFSSADCVAGTRLYVQASVYDAFMEKLIESAKEWTAGYGDPFAKGALGGPLVSRAQRDKVAAYVDSARTVWVNQYGQLYSQVCRV